MSIKILTEDSTQEELIEALGHVTREAQAEARRGHAGIHGQRYADLHAFIDSLLDLLED